MEVFEDMPGRIKQIASTYAEYQSQAPCLRHQNGSMGSVAETGTVN
jgi:hypothetical protein